MSGATSLVEEYSDLIAEIQECRQPFYLDKIVSINEDLSAAVIRKSSSLGYTGANICRANTTCWISRAATAHIFVTAILITRTQSREQE